MITPAATVTGSRRGSGSSVSADIPAAPPIAGHRGAARGPVAAPGRPASTGSGAGTFGYGARVTDNHRLAPGDRAPDFTLSDADGNEVSLADYRGRRVVVYFYPAASTPGCTKQACDFRDNLGELNSAGLEVIGISPDKPAALAEFRDAEQLNFPLLSDPERKVLTEWGAFGEKTMYGKKVTGVIRSTFLVDSDGKIEVAQYNVRATGHVAKLRRDLSV